MSEMVKRLQNRLTYTCFTQVTVYPNCKLEFTYRLYKHNGLSMWAYIATSTTLF